LEKVQRRLPFTFLTQLPRSTDFTVSTLHHLIIAMTNSAEPTAILSHLHRADGSATFSQNGYTVIGAVNGPIEVQRRDELPEEAAVDVILRPAAGVGGSYPNPQVLVLVLTHLVLGTRERHLELILQSTLRQIILIHNFPRTLIQITLQITSTPENDIACSKLVHASSVGNPQFGGNKLTDLQNLPILPALLQTAVLTLLSASMPLAMTLASVLLAISSDGSSRKIIRNPTIQEFQAASSVHVVAFTSHGQLLVAESEGSFTLEDWDEVYEVAKGLCCDDIETSDENIMQGDGLEGNSGDMMMFVKSALEEKVSADLHWKD
jgi:exosome complex component RRP46